MAILVELLNAHGKVIGLHKFTQSQIRIGRAYDNDVILLDPHSCAEHALLTLDDEGQWQLSDLDSVNGTRNSQGQRVNTQAISQSGQEFTLGKQRLRVIFSDQPVAATQPLSKSVEALRLLSSVPYLLLLILLISLSMAFDFWLGAIGEQANNWHRQLLLIPIILLACAIWPAFLALWARFSAHEPRLRQQVALTYSLILLWVLWDMLSSWLNFNVNNSGINLVLHQLVPAILLLSFFWLGFSLMSMKKRWLQGLLTLSLSSLFWLMPYLQSATPQMAPQYQSQLLPAGWLWRSPTEMEQFLQDSGNIFAKAQQQTEAAAANETEPDN
ncbi:FHA domain-containing protein [Arsukibacterium sp.]|uniref:FHA domain-containing protein n=1 Tax=Arsukibacterium sp. TaxID=1977258 RepID=UPI002FDB0B2E